MFLLPHIYVSDPLVAAVFEADNVSIDEFVQEQIWRQCSQKEVTRLDP